MLVENSSYQPQFIFKNKHFNTVYRTLFAAFETQYERKRIETSDGDFLDLDFSKVNSSKIVIIIHGLEGSSDSKYVQSLSQVLNENNYDALALNLRGCSGGPNRLLSSYHSGKTDDLEGVISYLETQFFYEEIAIVGYSLGGNMTLKYLGEKGNQISKKVKSTVTISVPCDLKGCSESLSKFWNTLYMQQFLITLKEKALLKLNAFPDSFLHKEKIQKIKNFYDFDNLYTAPAHGFKNAFDYWEKCSSRQFIPQIKIPTLLLTAQDDPFLSASCFPITEAKENKYFSLEITKYGGHVGFNDNFSKPKSFWLENRILEFLKNQQ